MNTKQFVGAMIIVSVILSVCVGILQPSNSENWYMLMGLLYMVFGIWGGIILIKD